jgi:hypothetical protein
VEPGSTDEMAGTSVTLMVTVAVPQSAWLAALSMLSQRL